MFCCLFRIPKLALLSEGVPQPQKCTDRAETDGDNDETCGILYLILYCPFFSSFVKTSCKTTQLRHIPYHLARAISTIKTVVLLFLYRFYSKSCDHFSIGFNQQKSAPYNFQAARLTVGFQGDL